MHVQARRRPGPRHGMSGSVSNISFSTNRSVPNQTNEIRCTPCSLGAVDMTTSYTRTSAHHSTTLSPGHVAVTPSVTHITRIRRSDTECNSHYQGRSDTECNSHYLTIHLTLPGSRCPRRTCSSSGTARGCARWTPRCSGAS